MAGVKVQVLYSAAQNYFFIIIIIIIIIIKEKMKYTFNIYITNLHQLIN